MAWTELTFGKNKGRSLPEVLFHDPAWFFWAIEEKVFEKRNDHIILEEARELDRKSRGIKIPNNESGRLRAKYIVARSSCSLNIVDCDEGDDCNNIRLTVIDLSYPRRLKYCNRLGYKIFIKCVKFNLFGDTSKRLTKRSVEEFFNNPDNFVGHYSRGE